MRPKWGHPVRLRATEVTIGGQGHARARIDVRSRNGEHGEIYGWEIRIAAGRDLRAQVGSLDGTLEFDANDQRWSFTGLTWRATCCKLIAYTGENWTATIL